MTAAPAEIMLPVGTILGSLVNGVLVHGLRLIEHAYPMPLRVGAPMPRAGEGRDPVVLVSGFANSVRGWDEWKRSLELDGFDVHVVHLPTHGLGSMDDAARIVAEFVEDVRRRTGRAKVDLVGFSEGGLLSRMVVAHHGGAASVDQVVTIGSPHNGIPVGWLVDAVRAIPLLGSALPESIDQLTRGSGLLRALDRADRAIRESGRVRYTSIFARHIDGFVTSAAARLTGAENVAVRGVGLLGKITGPSHFSVYHTSDAVYEAARGALLAGAQFDALAVRSPRAGRRRASGDARPRHSRT